MCRGRGLSSDVLTHIEGINTQLLHYLLRKKKKKEEKNIQKKKSWVQRIICGLCWNYEAGLCCLIGKRGGGKNRTCSRIEESLMLLINLVAKFAIVV